MGRTVREYTQKMAEISTLTSRKAYEHILSHGEYFEGALPSTALPRGSLVNFLTRVSKGKKWCFWNAQMLTMLQPIWGIEYYEGVGDNGVFIGAHAWNLYQGKVVDITWQDIPTEFEVLQALPLEKFQYFGVKIPYEFVRTHNPVRTRSVQPLLFLYLQEKESARLPLAPEALMEIDPRVHGRLRLDIEEARRQYAEYGEWYEYVFEPMVPIAQIELTPPWNQLRYEDNKKRIGETGKMPPAFLHFDDATQIYRVEDGIHRINAAKDLGYTHVPAVVSRRRTYPPR